MPTLRLTLKIELDGRPIPPFDPLVRTLTVDEVQTFAFEEANDGDTTTFSAVPITQLTDLQVYACESDFAVTQRVDGQTDAGLPLQAAGLVLLWNVDVDASTLVETNNNSGSTATLRGLGAGT